MDRRNESSLCSQTSSASDLLEKSKNNQSLPYGNSFISYSDIENPQLEISLRPEEDSSLLHDSSSIDPATSDSFSSLIPRSELSLKPHFSESDSESSVKLSAFECEFCIRYETLFGQSLVLVGSTGEFGEWDLKKGVKMSWKPGHLWTANLLIRSLPVEYKYVCHSNDEFIWEKGENRKVSSKIEKLFDSWQEVN